LSGQALVFKLHMAAAEGLPLVKGKVPKGLPRVCAILLVDNFSKSLERRLMLH
jgi:hypothetical protein